jgi:hypothetical protein
MRNKTNKIERIYNLIILDESGSMFGLEKMSVDGVNETIQTIKGAARAHPEQEQMFSFITFSDRGDRRPFRIHTLLSEIALVNEISINDYLPCGSTPLWDTMGIALSTLEREVGENSIALVTVITDGYENSSKEYSGKQIQEMVMRLDSKGWVFTYIGANQDAMMEAGRLGIRNSLNFRADEKGTKQMWMKEKSSRMAFYDHAADMNINACELKNDFFGGNDGDSYTTC